MEKIVYPLLYYKLSEEAFLGVLFDTGYQVVDKDIKKVKKTLQDFLQKEYKKTDSYPFSEFSDPRMKVIDVEVRPAYKIKNTSYPVNEPVQVPIVAIYGETDTGEFECFLPQFDHSFYYYNEGQLKSLVTHFATFRLSAYTPEDLFRLLQYPKPILDKITLKVKVRDDNWEFDYPRTFEVLERLADRYPHSKLMQRNVSAFPDAAWELEEKVTDVIEKLTLERSNLLIVGNHGVGKSSVLRQAIRKITAIGKKEKVSFSFWQMTPQRITSTSKYLGEWQATCEELVEDLIAANGILWIVDFIRLFQIGGEGAEDSVGAYLMSFIISGKLRLVGEVTPAELDSMRRLLPGFLENFQLLRIEELPENKIHNIIGKFAEFCGNNLKISLNKEAIELAYRILLRYYPYEKFPGKAIKFLGQCINEAQIEQRTVINKSNVIDNFVRQTGMPELFLKDEIPLTSKELETYFNKKIIGQPAAIQQMSSVVKIFKAGLNNPDKPISTMLFAGPTGVGKTASAKALSNYFFGKKQRQSPLVRIDMSEFQHPGTIYRFIGTGKEVGKLVQEIRERPFSVLLLDEIEKAHPAIFDALLTVMDEGVLVDAFGRVTNFRNTVIIMTSNLGASNQKSIGFGQEDTGKYDSAIDKFFRPEFINRIDQTVIFNSLKEADIYQITKIELAKLNKREGISKRGIKLTFTEQLCEHLSNVGFDELYGARPLQRAIEDEVVAPLSKWLLANKQARNRKLTLDYAYGLLVRIVGS